MGLWAYLILQVAFAAADTPKAVDLTPAIQYFSPYVHTLEKPVYTWNWFGNQNRDPVWQTAIAHDHHAGIDHVRRLAESFWRSYCSDPSDKSCLPLESAAG